MIERWIVKESNSLEKQEVEEGFIKCELCNGYGYDYLKDTNGYLTTASGKKLAFKCHKCNGTGQISWLEVIFDG